MVNCLNMSELRRQLITADDSASTDAFSRWRTSNPVTLFDAQQTYDLAPLVYEQITAESGATIAQGYAAASATVKASTSTRVPFKYPITLNAAGVARVNGRLSVLVQGLGATSATRCVLNWKEIR